MRQQKIIDYLKNTELFSGLDHDEIIPITQLFKSVRFHTNDIIVQEGERGNKMFVIMKGEVVVLKRMGMGERELARLGKGQVFGEMALISHERRSAAVKAETPTRCLVLHEIDFNDLLNSDFKLNRKILQILSNRVKQSADIASQHILTAYQTLLFSLSSLAESRDPETGAHLNRVRDYCVLTAELLAEKPAYKTVITPSFIEDLYTVSPLHDIGKVGISDSILLKRGKLTSDEYEIMKTHTIIGAKTIQKVLERCDYPTFHMAYNIVRYHHEHYDGKGYPDGLKEDAIPLEARIMTLADVLDALLSERVYKKAFSYDDSIAIIIEDRGKLFDPDMVDVLLANEKKFRQIHKKYKD